MRTDRDAFLRAIVDQDEDDAPRLVFADWLDEHGEAERTEFIRLQCRFAGQTVPDTAERMRAADLLDGHHHEWRREFGLAEREGVRPGEFERGFVGWVEVDTLADFRANADVLRTSTARKVRVKQEAVEETPSDWSDWPELNGVRGWDFSFWPFTPVEMRRFVASPHLSDLRSLTITESDLDAESLGILANTPSLTNLTDLRLPDHCFDLVGILALVRSPLLHCLRSLDLSSGFHPTVAVGSLASAANLASLRRLHLGVRALTGEASAAFADSPYLTNVRWLALGASNREPIHLRPLLGSRLFMGLERLDLSELELTPTDAEALFESPAPVGLRSLSLNVEQCGVAGVRALLASPWSAGLRELILSGRSETVDGDKLPRTIAEADFLGELIRLDLGETILEDETLSAVLNSSTLKRLVSLRCDISGSDEARSWAAMTGLPALRRLQVCIWASVGNSKQHIIDAIADGQLANRLTHLTANVALEETALGWHNRERWPQLQRRCVHDVSEELREIWGDVVDVWHDTRFVYRSEE